MDPVRLNLGCGDHVLDGWTNIDRKTGGEVYPLKEYADDSVDEIRASHILEHFSYRKRADVLAEWRRVLKPGGTLRVAVPDFDKIVDAYLTGKDWPVEQYLMGGHGDENDGHGAIFNRQLLIKMMVDCGFAGFRSWKSESKDCATLPVSLNIAGRKVLADSWKPQGIAACLSHPRLAHTECMFSAMQALAGLGVPLRRGGGVFWNQAMQIMLEGIIADGNKYALTLDYDAVFMAEDIVMLYDYMERHPEVSAVVPVQIGRDRDTPLMTVAGPDGKPIPSLPIECMDEEALQIRSGHFACALIRCSDLAKLPKPWLCHKPDRDGGWSEEKGRIDDDAWFWQLFADRGMKAMQHNRVSIGHVQVMVTWPTPHLTPLHQYQMDYHKLGKPEGALC